MSVNLPVVNAPYLSVDGLEIAITGNKTATVQVGRARNSSNESDIISNAILTLNAANNGANGLDSGSLANATLYSLYIVGDSSLNNNPVCILSANASAPLLPVGYDMYRKIGYLRTDGSANFLAGYFSGKSNNRKFMYDAPLATAVTAGNATSYTAVALTDIVPAVDNTPVYMSYSFTPGAASRVLNMTPGNATGNAIAITGQVTSVVVSGVNMVLAKVTSGVPEIDYKVSNSGDAVALNVAGYEYVI